MGRKPDGGAGMGHPAVESLERRAADPVGAVRLVTTPELVCIAGTGKAAKAD